MDLSIFNQDNSNYEGVIDSYTSLRWRRKYFEPSEFELHLPATLENINLLQIGRLVYLYEHKETGIIEKVSLQAEDMSISGRMLSSCLDNCYIRVC